MLYIYVLQLQNDKYYVGKTTNPHFRFDNHFTSNGTEWTRLHKPLKILELIPNCDDYDEEKYTYKYMDKCGIDNVRGGSYSSVVLDAETKKQLVKISNSINNRCFVCGKTDGHFAKECVQTRDSRDSLRYRRDSQRDSQRDYIPLQTLLTDTPEKMLSNSGDLEIIKRLKSIRIKLGDNILLNYKKLEYLSFKELVEDACNIFENYDDTELARIPTITSVEHAKSLRKYLLPCKIDFYTQIAELLDSISSERCILLQSGITFQELENNVLRRQQ
jgi:hypothetical protein